MPEISFQHNFKLMFNLVLEILIDQLSIPINYIHFSSSSIYLY